MDVTILLYLPIDTSLDDLAFVADWGQKIVGLTEERMILNGKEPRYIRHRVLPMMYNPENKSRSMRQIKPRENTESWLKLLKKQDKNNLPDWVKVSSEASEDESEPENEVDSANMEELCPCKENKKAFVDVIKEAVHFSLPCSRKDTYYADTDEDSIFSDDSSDSGKFGTNTSAEVCSLFSMLTFNPQLNNEGNNGSKSDISSLHRSSDNLSTSPSEGIKYNQNSNRHSSNSNYRNISYSNYNNYENNQNHNNVNTHDLEANQDQTVSHHSRHLPDSYPNSNNSSNYSSMRRRHYSSGLRSNSSSASSRRPYSKYNGYSNHSTSSSYNNKHVILSVASGYDRDSMKEVRKVIQDTGVGILSVGIGDRGMIGLGGYYIKKLAEISNLQNSIVSRLTNLV